MSPTRLWIALTALTLSAAGGHARADDLDNDDLTGEAVVQMFSWEPIITMMRVTHEGGGGADEKIPAAPEPLQTLPTLTAAWRELQPMIAILGPEDPPREIFVSGWHTLYGDKIEIRAHVFPAQKLQQMYDAPPKRFLIRHDILTNLSPSRKQEVLRRSFEITQWSMSLHQVAAPGEDPQNVNRPARAAPDDRRQFPMLSKDADSMPLSNGTNLVLFNENGRELKIDPGIWEIRSSLTMRGRLDPDGPYGPNKTVQGCIRFQVVEKSFQIEVKGYDSSGFSRIAGGARGNPKKSP